MDLQELRSRLSSIEGDPQMYTDLGPDEVPLLVELLGDDEAWMAARAIYALSRINSPEAKAAVEQAASSDRDEVRIAVAVTANLLPADISDRVLTKLLQDTEVGVRKYAIDSVTPENKEEVRNLVAQFRDSQQDVLKERAQSRATDLGY
jgi:HEAT repeats